MPDTQEINYIPTPTIAKFHQSDALVRACAGPLGSGKSAGMVMECLLRACAQQPFQGVRKTACVVIRNTYPELVSTTLKTWKNWIPESLGKVKTTYPITTKVVIPRLADGTRVEMDVTFLALDNVDDSIAKLKSTEFTFAWWNEAQYMHPDILETLLGRLGRYPAVQVDRHGDKIAGSGPSWSGLFMDFNMPDTDHLLYKALITEKRAGWEFFHQPPAVLEVPDPDDPEQDPAKQSKMWVINPEAENINNLGDGANYYLRQIPNLKRSKIRVDFEAKWGHTSRGTAVYAEAFDYERHVLKAEIKHDPSLPLLLGLDFGLNPAMIFAQVDRLGRLLILKEIVPAQEAGVSLEEFLEDWYRPFFYEHFSGVRQVLCTGDPYGRGRSNVDKRGPYAVLVQNGIQARPAATNEYLTRKEGVEKFLRKHNGMLINPSCTVLIKGFMSDYHYAMAGEHRKVKPEKNVAADAHDALQYLCLGVLHPVQTNVNPNLKGSKGIGW